MTAESETRKKRGPRTHQARMEHQLQVTSELAISLPPLASLIEALARRNLDQHQLEDRLRELKDALDSNPFSSLAVTGDDDRATAAQRYADATARLHILEKGGAAIMNAHNIAQAEASRQWSALKEGLLIASDSIPVEVIEVAQELVAAGVTKNGLERKTLRERLRAAVSDPEQRRHPAPTTALPTKLPSFEEVREMWRNLPNPIPGYEFIDRDLNDTSGKADSIGFYLPPFRSLDEITPGFSLSLRLMKNNKERYKRADQIISSWIAKNRYRPSPSTGAMQVKAWCFVLGFVHDYIDGIEEFNAVKFGSPWTGKGIEARRLIRG